MVIGPRLLFTFFAGIAAAGAQNQPAAAPAPLWHFLAFADGAYIVDFNFPANHLFRNRGTTAYVNEPVLNMSAAYLHKDTSEQSRWGMDLTLQAGKDSEAFGFSPVAPNLAGSRWLRHLGPTNVSYLSPVGRGLTIQGGIFNSFIGYDSLYSKDNLNYTRPWGADFTPYLMMGVNASYPFTSKLTAALFVISDYFHLAHPNNVPSSGGQVAYKANAHTTLKQTVLYGPHQADTSLEFWRFLSDSIAEWKTERFTTAFEYQVGTEGVAVPGSPRALWSASQLPIHWNPPGPFSATVRPEFAWDRDGRWTGSQQFIKAITSTLEYRVPYRHASAIFRIEHRYDNSHGTGGGFWRGDYLPTGVPALTPSQHLLAFALILTWEPPLHW
jgi:hypothetical protein